MEINVLGWHDKKKVNKIQFNQVLLPLMLFLLVLSVCSMLFWVNVCARVLYWCVLKLSCDSMVSIPLLLFMCCVCWW